MSQNDTVHIIGHKNPDADSICSAIAYENFKHAQGFKNFRAARCGNSNSRIDAILKTFNLKLPTLISDITPRVGDFMVRDVVSVNANATCTQALCIMDERDLRALPVVNNTGKLEGVVSIFQMGEYLIPKKLDPKGMRHVYTDIPAIIADLDADILHCPKENRQPEDLYVRIAAMGGDSFGKISSKVDIAPAASIVIVGDRSDIIEACIDQGVRLTVVADGLDINPSLIEKAKAKNVSLVRTPFDAASAAWIARASAHVEPMLEKSEVPVFHENETLESVHSRIAGSFSPIFCVVDSAGILKGVFTAADLLKFKKQKLALVDHNELTQAVDGADQVDIVEIVDHHRLGNPRTAQPIRFYNEPVGSTCTIVANMFRREGLTPEPSIAGAMMGGLISDTLNLRGPTTTIVDEETLRWLEGIAGVKADDLAESIFSAGSLILEKTPDEVVRADCKEFTQGDVRFSIAQVEELGLANFYKKQDILEAALEAYRASSGVDFSILFVTDINTQSSVMIIKGDESFIQKVSYPKAGKDYVFEMKGVVSRKKQLVPYVTGLLA